MPVIQPWISSTRLPATIIEEMKKLLGTRRMVAISRQKFLLEYGKLRTELESTKEYQTFLWAVRDRSGGICERCKKRKAVHVHHKVRMAINPDLALTVSNGEHVCRKCHQASHPRAKL